jgi:hypothetical protein
MRRRCCLTMRLSQIKFGASKRDTIVELPKCELSIPWGWNQPLDVGRTRFIFFA